MNQPKDRLNVLFIIADQHNAKVLGHAGHGQVKTPHLDRLAAEGTRFSRAIVQNPICTPSRTSYLSGQYCHNHGYYGNGGPRPQGLPSVFGHFRRHGYFTGAIGKIHCPEGWIEADTDVFHETSFCSVGGRSKEYEAFLKARGATDKEDHSALRKFGQKGRQSMEGWRSEAIYDESQEGWIVAATIRAMSAAKSGGKSFFLQASLPRPHQCTAPSEPFWSMYEDVALKLPPNTDYDLRAARKAPHLIATSDYWRRGEWALFEPRTFEAARLRKLRGYLGAVSQVDHAVGQLLNHLDQAGLADNTIVIYGSDHGDYACEHDLMEKAPGICSDAITRVPFIWRAPGVTQPGTVCDAIVESVDLATTVCSLAGLPLLETGDGKDISGLLRGDGVPVRELGVTEFAWSKSVRKGDFRLVWYPREMFPTDYPDGFGELYDLAADPWEMRNLFFEPAHQDKVRELQADLLNWLVTTTRPVSSLGLNAAVIPGDLAQREVHYKVTLNADRKFPPTWLQQAAHRAYI